MRTEKEYIETQIDDCRTRWFSDHRATLIQNPDVTIINWSRQGDWTYGCRFLIHRRWLTVVGDIGEAVYAWGQDVSMEFLAGLDFGYFHSKCEASETGRQFEQWAGDVAYTNIQHWLAQMDADCPPNPDEDPLERLRTISKNHPRDEVEEAVRETFNDGGLDSEDASMLYGSGLVPNCRCIGHFVGLKLALTHLKAARANPSP